MMGGWRVPQPQRIGLKRGAEPQGRLPLNAHTHAQDSHLPSGEEVAAVTIPLRELVVLVVDDSSIDRHLAGSVLAKALRARVVFAANGREALEAMRQDLPDVVVTDLQMPELDGLGLVQEIRSSFPSVPTILITAHGSEEVAIAALQKGAASYVPKRNIARGLADTVRDVVALSGSGRTQRKLFACWGRTEFEFSLENDTSLIPPLVAHLQQYSASIRPTDETEQLRVNIALHEAIRNAMHHGNLELSSDLRSQGAELYYQEAERRRVLPPYCSRRVFLRVMESRQESRYLIRDEGPGFDHEAHRHDPNDPMHLESPSGRGLFLMRMFMDELHYNERGNEITMIHRRQLASGSG
jgi:CheY-like chemotaxis protein